MTSFLLIAETMNGLIWNFRVQESCISRRMVIWKTYKGLVHNDYNAYNHTCLQWLKM